MKFIQATVYAVIMTILKYTIGLWSFFALMSVWFVVLGIIFLSGRGAVIYSFYYNKPKEEQEKYDTKALFRFEGWCLIVFSLVLLPVIAGVYFELLWIVFVGLAVLVFLAIGTSIYSKKDRKRFLKSQF